MRQIQVRPQEGSKKEFTVKANIQNKKAKWITKASQQVNTIQGQRVGSSRLACSKKQGFFRLFYNYFQLLRASMNVLERCKCILAQLELRLMTR